MKNKKLISLIPNLLTSLALLMGLLAIFNLINTSFNTHEYPIVCSLRDSLLELSKNRIDVLITKDYIYYK